MQHEKLYFNSPILKLGVLYAHVCTLLARENVFMFHQKQGLGSIVLHYNRIRILRHSCSHVLCLAPPPLLVCSLLGAPHECCCHSGLVPHLSAGPPAINPGQCLGDHGDRVCTGAPYPVSMVTNREGQSGTEHESGPWSFSGPTKHSSPPPPPPILLMDSITTSNNIPVLTSNTSRPDEELLSAAPNLIVTTLTGNQHTHTL